MWESDEDRDESLKDLDNFWRSKLIFTELISEVKFSNYLKYLEPQIRISILISELL
jgi:hypothetical protein